MKTFEHTSASQMGTFAGPEDELVGGYGEGCNRAWWFEKIAGYEKPQNASAARGGRIHKAIEAHLLTGAPLTDGLEQVAKFLPPRESVVVPPTSAKKTTVWVEHALRFPVDDTGIDLVGYVDLWSRGMIEDHKSTTDMKWFKTKEELAKNTQMLLYGYANAAAFRLDDMHILILAHNQLLVPRNADTVLLAQRTVAHVPVSVAREAWRTKYVPLTRRMKDVALVDDPSAVQPNWNACGRFGGCAFRDKCAALKAAGAGGVAVSPFARLSPTGVSMPALRLPPGLAAKMGQKPAASPAATSAVVQKSVGTLPPDAPPRDGKPAVAASAPVTPAVAPTAAAPAEDTYPGPTATDQQQSLYLLSLGWPAADIEIMDGEVFATAYAARVRYETVDLIYGEDDQGQFISGYTAKVVEAPAPVARRRVVAPVAVDVKAEPAPAATSDVKALLVGKPANAPEGNRQPRNAGPRLQALGYDDNQRRRLGGYTMRVLLDADGGRGIGSQFVSVLADGTAKVFGDAMRLVEPKWEGVLVGGGAPDPVVAVPVVSEADLARQAQERTEAADAAAEDEVLEAFINLGWMSGDVEDMDEDYAALVLTDGVTAPGEGFVAMRNAAGKINGIGKVEPKAVKTVVVDPKKRPAVTVAEPKVAEPTVKYADVVIDGFVLYIDCMPMKGEKRTLHLFEDFIAPHALTIAEQYNVAHLAEAQEKLFGSGPGRIAGRLLLPVNRPTGALIIDSRHPYAAACIDVLVPHAAGVVRGMGR